MNRLLKATWIRLTADRKKFGVMCGLLMVGMLLWGRLIIIQRIPRTGYADPAKVAAAEEAAKKALEQSGGEALAELPVVRITAPDSIRRDVFEIPESMRTNRSEESASLDQNAPKSGTDSSEKTEDPALVHRDRIRMEASSLRLESLIRGLNPMAIVNGSMLTVGAEINGFRLIEVRDRSIIVEKEGLAIEIQLHQSAPPPHKRRM